jgi:hypothetical protein
MGRAVAQKTPYKYGGKLGAMLVRSRGDRHYGNTQNMSLGGAQGPQGLGYRGPGGVNVINNYQGALAPIGWSGQLEGILKVVTAGGGAQAMLGGGSFNPLEDFGYLAPVAGKTLGDHFGLVKTPLFLLIGVHRNRN